jgi:predicted DNA-binding transcriptional regulator AlpA
VSNDVRTLFFEDIRELRLANSWTSLNRRIAKEGFPPGHMIGRRRVWTDREVFAWIESQPTENNAPLKGIAKKAKAEAIARRGTKRARHDRR